MFLFFFILLHFIFLYLFYIKLTLRNITAKYIENGQNWIFMIFGEVLMFWLTYHSTYFFWYTSCQTSH